MEVDSQPSNNRRLTGNTEIRIRGSRRTWIQDFLELEGVLFLRNIYIYIEYLAMYIVDTYSTCEILDLDTVYIYIYICIYYCLYICIYVH